MRPFFGLLIMLLFPLAALSQTSASDNALDRYEWQARLFFVFAETSQGEELTKQMADVEANKDGYLDRDLIVFFFVGDQLVQSHPPQEIDLRGEALRSKFRLPSSGFAAALVGLDGGVALRSQQAVDACALFTRIDGMPIRQNEIESSGNAVPCQ